MHDKDKAPQESNTSNAVWFLLCYIVIAYM